LTSPEVIFSLFTPEFPVAEILPSQTSDDTLFAGKLICRQYVEGYRFSVDAVLTAHFATPKAGQQVLDLGCGCGVIGLILAYRSPHITVTGLELQPDLALLAEENGRLNNLGDRFRVVRGDVRTVADVLPPERVDLVVCNPPYGTPAAGRISRQAQAAGARHELHGTLDDFVRASAFCVRNRGRVVFIYPARRCNVLLTALRTHRLTPKRLQPIYSFPSAISARLVLVEAMKNGGEQIEILAPFYIYSKKNGEYAPAMLALYQEDACWPR
jgi:tRNA1(Val) A37 N6-methylase TrmN6